MRILNNIIDSILTFRSKNYIFSFYTVRKLPKSNLRFQLKSCNASYEGNSFISYGEWFNKSNVSDFIKFLSYTDFSVNTALF